jgi:hypothetical protein
MRLKKDSVILWIIVGFFVLVIAIGSYFIFSSGESSSESSEKINIVKNEDNSKKCYDSDGGVVKNIKGKTEGVNYEGEWVVEEDYCTNPVGQKINSCERGYGCMVEEFQCFPLYGNQSNVIVDSKGYGCENGCQDGACI